MYKLYIDMYELHSYNRGMNFKNMKLLYMKAVKV